jgi:predicted dithiol-disulfide oxidoreductase (DUF899 family)
MNETINEQIHQLQEEITNKRKAIIELRKQSELEPIQDYTLTNHQGESVSLSSLFGDSDELLIIHNMGKGCKYCTLWADGFNGIHLPLGDRVPYVLVSPDTPADQQAFAASRGWTMPMLSARGSSFISDLGFYKEGQGYYPGVSALVRRDGQIYRSGFDFFGPGDPYSAIWHFMDLLPTGVRGWQPKYEYTRRVDID